MQRGSRREQSCKQDRQHDPPTSLSIRTIRALARFAGAREVAFRQLTETLAGTFIESFGRTDQRARLRFVTTTQWQQLDATHDGAVGAPFSLKPAIHFILGRIVHDLPVGLLSAANVS